MTSNRDKNESFNGLHVDLPFFFAKGARRGWEWHIGMGMNMDRDDAYQRARRRVRTRLGFYRHLATYAAVMVAIILVDLVTGGGISNLVLWLAGIWGAFLVWRAFNAFVFPIVWSRETEERMIEEEMRRHQNS